MLPDIRIHKLILLRQTYKKNKDDIKPGSLISSFISIKCKSLIKINKHVLFVFPYPQSLPIAPNLRIFNYLTRIVPTITPVLFVFPPIHECGHRLYAILVCSYPILAHIHLDDADSVTQHCLHLLTSSSSSSLRVARACSALHSLVRRF